MLQKAALIQPASGDNPSMTCFKVPKKDGQGRFIMDCRPINNVFKDERIGMESEDLQEVIQKAQEFPIVLSTDANAFFFFSI